MIISLALNDVYVTLHSENSNEHSHCGWPGKCFFVCFVLFVCLFVFFVSISNVKSFSTFSRLLIMHSSDLTISHMTFINVIIVIILFFFDYTK